MASVLNNISALTAQRNLAASNMGLSRTLGKLSTGMRIVQASDDAAGLAIANNLKKDVAVLNQAVRNANDGISIIQTADKALEEVSNLLIRAATLAEQAASDTSGADSSKAKEALSAEYDAITDEIVRLGGSLQFNGTVLFSGSAEFDIKVGGSTGTTVITVNNANGLGNLSSTAALGITDSATALNTKAAASTELGNLSAAIATVSSWRGNLGAAQSRLQTTINSLSVASENIQAAESAIRDADIATEVVNMTKFQILTQSGTAALAQANLASQNILALLR
mgnify:FL=1